MRKKIGLVGYLGYSVKNPIIGGQMSKTRGIYSELVRRYGQEGIVVVDTSNWKREAISVIFQMFRVARMCDPIILMPNKKGIKIILPFFARLKSIFKYSLSYPVVGGWVTGHLEKFPYIRKTIRQIDYILPETKALADELSKYVDCKIDVMTIFSTRKMLDEKDIIVQGSEEKKYCTFSRVTPEKGIDEAIEAISAANVEKKVCHLDVWGPIDSDYEEHYRDLFEKHSTEVTYKGVLAGEEGLNALSGYYMMLFPTFYPGEGFPITVCESFMAGLPVIASDWRFNSELVKDGETGFLIPVHDKNALVRAILYTVNNEEEVLLMKKKSLDYSRNFMPEMVTSQLFAWIDKVME